MFKIIHESGPVPCLLFSGLGDLIQGTIFASTKLPLKHWLLGMYLFTHAKDGISSLHLPEPFRSPSAC